MTAADVPKGWLPLREAAASLGVTRQSVLNWVKQGKVDYRYVTRGRRRGLRIDVASITCRLQPRLFSYPSRTGRQCDTIASAMFNRIEALARSS